MDARYRETFLKSFPNLLAMSVYTIFVTCFPESYMGQFNDEFREFISQISYLWLSGCKPTPRAYTSWNLAKLDPPAAVFAKEVLNNKQNNIIEDIKNIGTAYQNNFSSNKSRVSDFSSMIDSKKSSNASTQRRRRFAIIAEDISEENESYKEIRKTNFFRNSLKKESHPAG